MSEGSDFSLLVGYGSDMGSAEYVAMQFAEATTALGIAAEETELNQIDRLEALGAAAALSGEDRELHSS